MKKVCLSLAALLVLAASVRACPPLEGASFQGACGSAAAFQVATPFVATTNVLAVPSFGVGFSAVGVANTYGGFGVGVRTRGFGLGGGRNIVRGGRGAALRGRGVGQRGRGVGVRGRNLARGAGARRR